jgi:hypothetical protein
MSVNVELFWQKARITGPDDCWEWTACKNNKGYGKFGVGRKLIIASRVALHLATGMPLSTKLHALHKCDNPGCVNPNHLWWGTHQENLQDASAKGRCAMQSPDDLRRAKYIGDLNPMRKYPELREAQSKRQQGEKSHRAKLTEDQVREIINLRKSGQTQRWIADLFGVTREAVARIDQGRNWSHLGL